MTFDPLAMIIVVMWMCFSAFFVIFFKIAVTSFPHPIALTGFHQLGCWLFFGCMRFAPCPYKERLMPDSEKQISWTDYMWGIVPISLLMAAGLALGNTAVKFSAVAFLQLIKPAVLIWGSLVAFAFGLEPASCTHMAIVGVIASGVSIAACHNLDFNMLGFILQLLGTFTEGTRIVMIQNVTNKYLKLDPLTVIYYYAPIACCSLFVLSAISEGTAPWTQIGDNALIVGMNVAAAVMLNVLIVLTISRTSAVISMLCGVLKDILIIAASVVIFRSPIGVQQVVGYSLSTTGIVMYKVYKQHIDKFLAFGLFGGSYKVLLGDEDSADPSLEKLKTASELSDRDLVKK